MSLLQKIDGKPSACCARGSFQQRKCRFPLPDVPPGWTPNPKSLWASEDPEKKNLQSPRPPSGPEPHGNWMRSNISADQVSIYMHVTPWSTLVSTNFSVELFWAKRLSLQLLNLFLSICPKRIERELSELLRA